MIILINNHFNYRLISTRRFVLNFSPLGTTAIILTVGTLSKTASERKDANFERLGF